MIIVLLKRKIKSFKKYSSKKISLPLFIFFVVFSILVLRIGDTVKKDYQMGLAVSAAGICPGMPTATDIDGNIYDTVQVNEQCWLKQNLKVTRNPSGGAITRFCYDNNPANCDTDGGLYTWDNAMNWSAVEGAQGICPTGWHIPADSQWYFLENGLTAGTCSPTRNFWDCDPAGTALKVGGSTGFDVIMTGDRQWTTGNYVNRGNSAFLWSSTRDGSGNPWIRNIVRVLSGTDRYFDTPNGGLWGQAIRCIYAPPVRFNGSPAGTALLEGTTSTTISLSTDEVVNCKYSTSSGIAYDAMTNTFSNTDSTSHTQIINGLANGNTYNYYIKCNDVDMPNGKNTDDYVISFSVEGHPNIAGYAWSENIGWISFNSSNCDTNIDGIADAMPPAPAGCPAPGTPVPSYGVNLDLGITNDLSGYAWSENIGWITFEGTEVAGCPSGTCQPRYDSGTGELLGWARACSIFQAGCSGALKPVSETGGWDGWISLNCLNGGVCASSNYKVLKNSNDFTGFAWGNDVIGWVEFNPTIGGGVAIANQPPQAINLAVAAPASLCNVGVAYTFQWTFSDLGDTESQFQIQIDNNNDFSSPTVDRTFSGLTNPDGAINTQAVLLVATTDAQGADKVSYNTTYYWRVRVWDSANAPSGWTSGSFFTTPDHLAPSVDFTPPVPPLFFANELINFNDNSVCYDSSGAVPCKSWVWNFEGVDELPIVNPPNLNGNTTHTFTTANTYDITLTVTDQDDNSCTNPLGSKVLKSLQPKWREVVPD